MYASCRFNNIFHIWITTGQDFPSRFSCTFHATDDWSLSVLHHKALTKYILSLARTFKNYSLVWTFPTVPFNDFQNKKLSKNRTFDDFVRVIENHYHDISFFSRCIDVFILFYMFSEEIIDDEFDEEDEINFDTENPNGKQGIMFCQHFFFFYLLLIFSKLNNFYFILFF